MNAFELILPPVIQYPIILSLPHIGTGMPEKISAQLKPELLPPDDTDWFLDRLYGFALTLGIPVLKANYSRWVIDLNRSPEGIPLYNDGRIITHACTTTNFEGIAIYKDERHAVTDKDVEGRKRLYFDPYHRALQDLLEEVKKTFGLALLWDGHSIRRNVPRISLTDFPDFIIGTNDYSTAPLQLSDNIAAQLRSSFSRVTHNHPFKGGYITRTYGLPHQRQYALQLEMSKDLYMKNNETNYDEEKAGAVGNLLKAIFEETGNYLLAISKKF